MSNISKIITKWDVLLAFIILSIFISILVISDVFLNFQQNLWSKNADSAKVLTMFWPSSIYFHIIRLIYFCSLSFNKTFYIVIIHAPSRPLDIFEFKNPCFYLVKLRRFHFLIKLACLIYAFCKENTLKNEKSRYNSSN